MYYILRIKLKEEEFSYYDELKQIYSVSELRGKQIRMYRT